MASKATNQQDEQCAPSRHDADWKNIQERAFCRWANERLKAVKLEINDLETDLSDGVRLIELAESLAGVKVTQRYNAKPTTRTQKLENVTVCLQFFERQQNVRIVNIDSADIVDGNMKLILGLMWTLVLHYSISLPSQTHHHGDAAAADAAEPITSSKLSPKQQLLLWINQHVSDRSVKNFTSDWKDGKTLADLVSCLAPGQCSDWRTWDETNAVANTKRAMDAATVSLHTEPLITAEEMCHSHVDEFSIMTYLSQFLCAKPHQDVAAKSAQQLQSMKEASSTKDDEDARQAALLQAYGDGLSTGYVGHPAKFMVTSTDRKPPQPVHVTIEGPSKVRLSHQVTSDGFEFSYIVSAEGEYLMSVMCCDRLHIPGSPFRPKFDTITNSYKVTVFTGNVFGAGTDANVYIVFVGEIGESGQIALRSSKTHFVNKFEKAQRDEFFVDVHNIGQLKYIRMGHDNAGGPGSAWFLERVEIELPLLHRRWNFPHSRWISKDDDDRKLEHVLYPDNIDCTVP